ncbi:AAA family ATPase [Roseateles sp.]|uniref:AAA family ATPase n=1 Tax=Roseateles sp. TaxID=1971397 RepID=UPI0031DDE406
MFEDQFKRAQLTQRVNSGKGLCIATDPCVLLLEKLTEWLCDGALGGIVYGVSRQGKTMATKWVLKNIHKVIGSVPSAHVPIRGGEQLTDQKFFSYLLQSVKHRHQSGNAGDKRTRLCNFLCDRAIRSGSYTFILFLDEAQKMLPLHYAWLQNLGNEMEKRDVRLFLLQVGQPELVHVETKLLDAGLVELPLRYTENLLEFPGITSHESLRECLEGFDSVESPPGIKFYSNYDAAHISLSDHSKKIWQCFELISDNFGAADCEIPMRAITRFVTKILNALAKQKLERCVVSDELIQSSVIETRFEYWLKLRSSGVAETEEC